MSFSFTIFLDHYDISSNCLFLFFCPLLPNLLYLLRLHPLSKACKFDVTPFVKMHLFIAFGDIFEFFFYNFLDHYDISSNCLFLFFCPLLPNLLYLLRLHPLSKACKFDVTPFVKMHLFIAFGDIFEFFFYNFLDHYDISSNCLFLFFCPLLTNLLCLLRLHPLSKACKFDVTPFVKMHLFIAFGHILFFSYNCLDHYDISSNCLFLFFCPLLPNLLYLLRLHPLSKACKFDVTPFVKMHLFIAFGDIFEFFLLQLFGSL